MKKKEGWVKKKLGEVCEVFVDGNWIESKDQSDTGIRLIQTGNIGKGFFKNKSDNCKYISEETFEKLQCTQIYSGDILISRLPEPIGRGCILPKLEGKMITAVDCSIIRLKKELLSKYLIYYTLSDTYLNNVHKYVTGAVHKRISRKNLASIPVYFPPLPEQQQIVAELDCLQGIIDKKKEQLQELDKLAQSIFYTMFGDPMINDKRWEQLALSHICKNLDSKRKPITAKDRIEGCYPYYGASGIVDYVHSYIFEGDYLLVSEDGANLLIRNTPIAFPISGKNWVNNHAHVLKFDDSATQVFIEYFINSINIESIVTGCAQPKLTQKNLNDILVFDVPLPLQQEFADKISAIEQQKARITQSLQDTETLFQSRMDYYFG